MCKVIIRQAEESDVGMVASILKEARDWRISQGTPMWTEDDISTESIRRDMLASHQFWFAEVNNTPEGCLRFQLTDELIWPNVIQHESAFIHRFAVRRRVAGGLVSRKLLNWAKSHALELEKEFLRLNCDATIPELCKVYSARGFERVGQRQVGCFLAALYQCKLGIAHE